MQGRITLTNLLTGRVTELDVDSLSFEVSVEADDTPIYTELMKRQTIEFETHNINRATMRLLWGGPLPSFKNPRLNYHRKTRHRNRRR